MSGNCVSIGTAKPDGIATIGLKCAHDIFIDQARIYHDHHA